MRSGSRLARSLSTRGRELAAFARQAWLLRHDTGEPVIPEAAVSGDDVVVFLHGLFASAGVLRPLRRAVEERAGAYTAALSYLPGPGVAELADRVRELLAKLPEAARVHLVGHSLGGIVARFFVQEIGDPRVVQTISMASPFAGVPRARLFRFGGAMDLDETSPLLRKIVLGSASAAHVPHLSIVAEGDALVRSPVGHALPGGEVIVMEGLGHNTLLFDDAVATLVARRVRSKRPPPRT